MIARFDRKFGEVSDRDWNVLETITEFHFLTTRQLARFHFDVENGAAIPRRVNHAMARLRALNLVTSLERRIGGVRAGSAGFVWTVTDAGRKAVAARRGETPPVRLRNREPSTTFLEHTLAVAEVALVTREVARRHQLTVVNLESEPAAWRTYLGGDGVPVHVKPDLALVIHNGEFEDRWFLEVDLDTEPPSRVLAKCLSYDRYRATGIEQRRHEVFPAVLWVVPSERRAIQLSARLQATDSDAFQRFTVVTLVDLANTLLHGPAPTKPKPGGQKGEPSP